MNEKSYKCEVITPMFLHGADGRTPEMRLPSLKGSLRFWWRAIHYDYDILRLKEEESQRFGGSKQEIGRSSILLRSQTSRDLYEKFESRPLPHHKEGRKSFPLPAIKQGKTFTIILRARKEIEYYNVLFQLAALLGGIGKRSRRGFGSFRIIQVDGEEFSFDYKIESLFSLIDRIAPDRFFLENNKIKPKNATVSPDYPYIKEIKIGKEYQSDEMLLKTIGQATHDCNDDSLGFGGRLASPIYVSALKDAQGSYYPIITTLNTVLKDQGSRNLNMGKQKEFKGRIL